MGKHGKKNRLKKILNFILMLLFLLASVNIGMGNEQNAYPSGILRGENESMFNFNKQQYLSPNFKDMILWGWWWPDFPERIESFFESTVLAEFTTTATALSTVDFNNDGLLDVVLKWHNGPFDEDFEATISILFNNGKGNDFSRMDVYTIDYTRIEDLNAADYDGDGDVDILFTYSSGEGKIYGEGWMLFNDGENGFGDLKNVFFHDYVPDRERINPHIASADFDNDGDIDFLVGDFSGLVSFYSNDGSGEFIHVCDSDFDGRGVSYGLDAGDFNGDGLLDFIVTEVKLIEDDFTNGFIYVKYNDGSSTCFAHENYKQIVDLAVWEYETFFCTTFPVVGGCIRSLDYNADGFLDIVYGGLGNMFLFVYQEDGTFEPFTVARLAGEKNDHGGFYFNTLFYGGLTVGDFDNDDLTDVMIGGSFAVIKCLYNTGSLIDIVFPDRSCIIHDNKITKKFLPLYFPLKYGTSFVTGDITIKTQELEPLSKVEFYLDDKLVFTDEERPFEWEWTRFSFGRHTVKAVAYDLEGNSAGFDTTQIWKFL